MGSGSRSAVDHVAVGDSVIVHPLMTCGLCLPCRAGNDMHCQASTFPGISTDGGFAELPQTNAGQLSAWALDWRPPTLLPWRRRLDRLPRGQEVHPPAGSRYSCVVIGAGGLGHIGVQA